MAPVSRSDVIGVFGGSGFYEFLSDASPNPVLTPYGSPAADPMVGTVEGIDVVFIPRHGRDHQFPPHKVPYRANVDAMRSLGAALPLAPRAKEGTIHGAATTPEIAAVRRSNWRRVIRDMSLSVLVMAYLIEASCVLTLLKNSIHRATSGIDSYQLYEYSRPNMVGLIPRR